jgi:hypothetical protein
MNHWRRRYCRKHGHRFEHRTVDVYYCLATRSTCAHCGFATWRYWEDWHA